MAGAPLDHALHDPHPALRVLSALPPGAPGRAGARPRTTAPRWRVLVLPHAGGTAGAYRRLVLPGRVSDAVPDDAVPDDCVPDDAPEVVAVQYPGRETRYRDPLAWTAAELLADIAAPVRGLLRDARPTVLLGHSLGASLALRLVAGLDPRERPDLLVLSARATAADPLGRAAGAPGRGLTARLTARLAHLARPARGSSVGRPGGGDVVPWAGVPAPGRRSDPELRAWLASLGGTPAALLDDPELLALHTRALRADLAVHDSLGARAPLRARDPRGGRDPVAVDDVARAEVRVPLVLVAGTRDLSAPPEAMAGWAALARAGVRTLTYDAGHFLHDDQVPDLLARLRSALAAVEGQAAP